MKREGTLYSYYHEKSRERGGKEKREGLTKSPVSFCACIKRLRRRAHQFSHPAGGRRRGEKGAERLATLSLLNKQKKVAAKSFSASIGAETGGKRGERKEGIFARKTRISSRALQTKGERDRKLPTSLRPQKKRKSQFFHLGKGKTRGRMMYSVMWGRRGKKGTRSN